MPYKNQLKSIWSQFLNLRVSKVGFLGVVSFFFYLSWNIFTCKYMERRKNSKMNFLKKCFICILISPSSIWVPKTAIHKIGERLRPHPNPTIWKKCTTLSSEKLWSTNGFLWLWVDNVYREVQRFAFWGEAPVHSTVTYFPIEFRSESL